jgi:AbiV family abortive infection protein
MMQFEELHKGIRLCKWNIEQLLKDANILCKNGSYRHAQVLAILAMEKYAKKIVP